MQAGSLFLILVAWQADHLRQQTLQQMHRILTTRQAARGLLAMGDYFVVCTTTRLEKEEQELWPRP
jgi:hypothetical protein